MDLKRFLSRKRFLIWLVFLSVLITHAGSSNILSYDSIWSIHTARSILHEGDIDLDEYQSQLEVEGFRDLLILNGHYYSIFPVGASVLALPFVAAADIAFDYILPLLPSVQSFIRNRTVDELGELDSISVHKGVELLTASFIVALTAVFILLIGLKLLHSPGAALLLVFVFAFCSPALSTASRGLWAHGPSMLMLALALHLLLTAEEKPAAAAYVSLPLAFSFVVRPTNALPILLLTVYVFIKFRRMFLRYILWSLPIAVLFLLFNLSVYGTLLSPYYFPERLDGHVNMLVSLAGTLVSPGRGLFVFAPVFILSLYGIWVGIRRGRLLDKFLVGMLLLHWVVIASFKQWWGGHAFGPRYFTDMLPVLVFFLVPVIRAMSSLSGPRRVFLVSAFTILTALSFAINVRGANRWETIEWCSHPSNIDFNQSRLWDWGDLQFLR
jgi:hypothetical protein